MGIPTVNSFLNIFRKNVLANACPGTSAGHHAAPVEQATGREVGWINRYLDLEYVRRLADKSLRNYAYHLLDFVRCWESVHHTGDVVAGDLTESTLLDYVRFQASRQPRPSGSTINARVAVADRALRNEFPKPPARPLPAFIKPFYGVRRWALAGRGWR